MVEWAACCDLNFTNSNQLYLRHYIIYITLCVFRTLISENKTLVTFSKWFCVGWHIITLFISATSLRKNVHNNDVYTEKSAFQITTNNNKFSNNILNWKHKLPNCHQLVYKRSTKSNKKLWFSFHNRGKGEY